MEASGAARGDDAVSVLVAELNDPTSIRARPQYRGSTRRARLASPLMIELLRSPQWRESITSEYCLKALTHRREAATEMAEPPPSGTYLQWIRWWKTDEQTATNFITGQYAAIEPLRSPRGFTARSNSWEIEIAQVPFWADNRLCGSACVGVTTEYIIARRINQRVTSSLTTKRTRRSR